MTKEIKDIDHRKFGVTLQPVQLYEAVKASIKKGELDDDRLLTLFRITADQLNKGDAMNNVKMWEHIKGRVEKFFIDRRKKGK